MSAAVRRHRLHPAERLLTAREVTEVTGISRRRLRRLTAGGDLTFIRSPGGEMRFRAGDVAPLLTMADDPSRCGRCRYRTEFCHCPAAVVRLRDELLGGAAA